MAGDGIEAEFDLDAALARLDYIENEEELCRMAEAVAKQLEPVGEALSKRHVSTLTLAVSRSRLASNLP